MRSLARAFASRTHNVWKEKKAQNKALKGVFSAHLISTRYLVVVQSTTLSEHYRRDGWSDLLSLV